MQLFKFFQPALIFGGFELFFLCGEVRGQFYQISGVIQYALEFLLKIGSPVCKHCTAFSNPKKYSDVTRPSGSLSNRMFLIAKPSLWECLRNLPQKPMRVDESTRF